MKDYTGYKGSRAAGGDVPGVPGEQGISAGQPGEHHRVSPIARAFDRLREKGEKALIPFIMAGDPDLETTEKLVLEMERRGADLVELGLPFSDPLADGPVIQQAAARALQGGTRTPDLLGLARRLRSRTAIPLVILTYYNPVYRYGAGRLVKEAASAGINGLIIPDLPLEESGEMQRLAGEAGIDLIYLVAPTSTEDRLRETGEKARGFIYCVSLTGVTGEREEFSAGAANLIKRVKKYTTLPLALGFGISTPGQARQAATCAAGVDGVIVGSALIRMIEENRGSASLVEKVGDYVGRLKAAIGKEQSSSPEL